MIRFKFRRRDFEIELMLPWGYFWRSCDGIDEFCMSDRHGMSGARELTGDKWHLYNIKSFHPRV